MEVPDEYSKPTYELLHSTMESLHLEVSACRVVYFMAKTNNL